MAARLEEPSRHRLGLALSGGGFRAAFFHIGVLARMAELGILRAVEVISTVSGGSIIGALYYIHVRNLLQEKPDSAVTDQDYVDIVARIEKTFVRGVETNLRGRTFRHLGKNFRMARTDYSRSDRLGELYDETFYRPAWNDPLFGDPPNPLRRTMIEMRELLITPAGVSEGFNPVRQNESRKAPVPILVVNATSLNTGHNWRFEAVGMGEPDRAEVGVPEEVAAADPREEARREVDRNERLRWTRYEKLADTQATFELGIAVAASACVPTLFHPLPVTRLFAGEDGSPINVQLVDGGVHDNQGIEGLIEFDCNPVIVSDASGYLPDDPDPATRIPAVAGRALGIYGDRVREEQLMNARLDDKQRPLGVMHLRKGITGYARAPVGKDGAPIEPPRPEPPGDFRGERFGVHPEIQDFLSKVRTDLDAFSEVEAHSLMLDGYRMAGPNLEHLDIPGRGGPVDGTRWAFMDVAEAAEAGTSQRYRLHLARAKSRFGKPILLSWPGRLEALLLVAIIAAVVTGLLLIDAVRSFFSEPIPVWVVVVLLAAFVLLVFLYLNARLPQPLRWIADRLYTQAVPVMLALPFWLGALVVLVFSRTFVSIGRVGRVLSAPSRPRSRDGGSS
jgi:predicted acylesterase/phospholipase RssA